MTLRNKILIGISAVHLGVVSMGANYSSFSAFPQFGKVGSVLDYYGGLSGADSSYGFFAAPIDGQVRARFEIVDQQGNKTEVKLAGGNNEADIRIRGVFTEFRNNDDEDYERYKRSLAASLAGNIFGRYPESKQVNVRLEELLAVSMDDYRQGKRGQWRPVYELGFVHDKI
jgi:hypothetical protein